MLNFFTVYSRWAVTLDGHLCLSNSPLFNLSLLYFRFVVILIVLSGK